MVAGTPCPKSKPAPRRQRSKSLQAKPESTRPRAPASLIQGLVAELGATWDLLDAADRASTCVPRDESSQDLRRDLCEQSNEVSAKLRALEGAIVHLEPQGETDVLALVILLRTHLESVASEIADVPTVNTLWCREAQAIAEGLFAYCKSTTGCE